MESGQIVRHTTRRRLIEYEGDRCYIGRTMDKLIAFQMQAEIGGHLDEPPLQATKVRLGPRTYAAEPRSNIDAAETFRRIRRRLRMTLDYLATR
jgi:hypothetical protein